METRGVEQSIEAMAIAGDRRAIDAVWSTNRRWVAAVVAAHKPRFLDLDDLLQDIALLVVKNIKSVRNPDHVRAWMRTVAINVVRTAVRSAQSRPHVGLDDVNANDGRLCAVDDDAERDADAVSRVDAMVHRLPIEYREPLMMRALHGLRTRQIAEILELEPPTVDTRIARARRMLREQMDLAESPPSVAGTILPATESTIPTTTVRDTRATRGSRT